MSSIKGMATVAGHDVFTASALPMNDIGTVMLDSQGRELRYIKNGAVALLTARLVSAPANLTNHHAMAVDTPAIAATTLTVTLGATAAVLNEYAGGFLNVVDDTGEGYTYEVLSHPAADSAATLVVTLKDPIKVAFGASATVDLVHNPFNGVIAAATATDLPVGVTVVPIPVNNFGWVVKSGQTACLAEATLTLGAQLEAGTAGGVDELNDVSDPILKVFVGYAHVAGVSGEHPLINVRL